MRDSQIQDDEELTDRVMRSMGDYLNYAEQHGYTEAKVVRKFIRSLSTGWPKVKVE